MCRGEPTLTQERAATPREKIILNQYSLFSQKIRRRLSKSSILQLNHTYNFQFSIMKIMNSVSDVLEVFIISLLVPIQDKERGSWLACDSQRKILIYYDVSQKLNFVGAYPTEMRYIGTCK